MRRRFVAARFARGERFGWRGEVQWYCDRPHELARRLICMRWREQLGAVLYLPPPSERGMPSDQYVVAQTLDAPRPAGPQFWQAAPGHYRVLEPAMLNDPDYLDELAGVCWQMAEAIDASRPD